MRRNIEVGEVADAALFLLGPQSRGITGEILFVDADSHIRAPSCRNLELRS